MQHKLLPVLVLILFCLFMLFSCGEDEAVAPKDTVSSNATIAQLLGNWQCTHIEESVYMNNGQVLRVTENESDDVFTFANTYYQKKSSPYRYFVYGASRGSNGNPILHLEEYDARYYTVEVTSLNTSAMRWRITFQGSNAKAITNIHFRR